MRPKLISNCRYRIAHIGGRTHEPNWNLMTNRSALFLVNLNSCRGRESAASSQVRFSINAGSRSDRGRTTLARMFRKPFVGTGMVYRRSSWAAGMVPSNGAAAGLMETRLPPRRPAVGNSQRFRQDNGHTPRSGFRSRCHHQERVDTPSISAPPTATLFFNVASIGFSADLAASPHSGGQEALGQLGYGIVAARLLKSSRLFTAHLDHDGRTEKLKTLQVSVGNGRFYGGGMTVHADATATDGMLDFYSLEWTTGGGCSDFYPALRRGTHGQWDDVRSSSTKALTISTSTPRAVNLDGELKTHTPVRFEILEKSHPGFRPALTISVAFRAAPRRIHPRPPMAVVASYLLSKRKRPMWPSCH